MVNRNEYCKSVYNLHLKSMILVCLCFFTFGHQIQAQKVTGLASDLVTGLKDLNLPIRSFDYMEEFKRIPSMDILNRKKLMLSRIQSGLDVIDYNALSLNERILYAQLQYELNQHEKHVWLEIEYKKKQYEKTNGIGLAGLVNGKEWYQHYVRRYTNTELSPDELLRYGQHHVAQAKTEIVRIQKNLGYESKEVQFYQYLASDRFFYSDSNQIITKYRDLENIVRSNLKNVLKDTLTVQLGIAGWIGATNSMPPAVYQPGSRNFAVNMANIHYNIRAMDWLFLHEGIPGHHYQMSKIKDRYNPFQDTYYYLGNLEGWSCYVESLGKDLGLYASQETELARWEWDLIRSVRIVMDVGIHAKGWTKNQALDFWAKNVVRQDDIAEREVNRVTNWPGQCLSYKVGSMVIEKMKHKLSKDPNFDIKRFHFTYLSLSSVPLNVVEKYMEELYYSDEISKSF